MVCDFDAIHAHGIDCVLQELVLFGEDFGNELCELCVFVL